MSERLLRLTEVESKTGRRRSTIYRDIGRNEFPKPVKVGASSLWPETEVNRWIDSKVSESRSSIPTRAA